jgi:sulfur-carrier protein
MCVRAEFENVGNNLQMATVRFTESIQRHVQCPTREVAGSTLREVLEGYFQGNDRARRYVLDDQNRLRRHMAIFIDGGQIRDREGMTDAVNADSVVDLIQSLSGG